MPTQLNATNELSEVTKKAAERENFEGKVQVNSPKCTGESISLSDTYVYG